MIMGLGIRVVGVTISWTSSPPLSVFWDSIEDEEIVRLDFGARSRFDPVDDFLSVPTCSPFVVLVDAVTSSTAMGGGDGVFFELELR